MGCKYSIKKKKNKGPDGFGILTLFSFDLRKKTPSIRESLAAEIRFVSDESFFASENSIDNDSLFKDRLKNGDICCCAIFEGEIVSYCWIALHRACVGEIGKTIILNNKEIYLYDAFTKPAYRGNGLFPKILSVILSYGRVKGYQRALIFALSSNISSIAAIKKTDFRDFQNVYFLDISGNILCRFGNAKNGEKGIEKQFEKLRLINSCDRND